MSVIEFQPTQQTSWAAQLQRDLERAFDLNWRNVAHADEEHRDTSDWLPPVDIRETDTAYLLAVDIPGVAPEQLEITSDKGVLTIRGQRPGEVDAEANRYRRIERPYGKFVRRFTLPDTANFDGIAARTSNGVLTVTIPKQEAVQPRRIEITSG